MKIRKNFEILLTKFPSAGQTCAEFGGAGDDRQSDHRSRPRNLLHERDRGETTRRQREGGQNATDGDVFGVGGPVYAHCLRDGTLHEAVFDATLFGDTGNVRDA